MQYQYLMLGYPGAGKTTVAQYIAEITGAEHIWADHVRKEMFEHPTYTDEENTQLYESLNQKAYQLLQAGKSVVYDTAFNHYEDRQKLAKLAQNAGAKTVIIWVRAPRDIAKQRATTDTHIQPTRILGDMHHEHFETLSDKMELPQSDETAIEIDGQNVSRETVTSALNSIQ